MTGIIVGGRIVLVVEDCETNIVVGKFYSEVSGEEMSLEIVWMSKVNRVKTRLRCLDFFKMRR